MPSALDHQSVTDAYLDTEVLCGRVARPFTALPFPDLQIRHFGVILKNNQASQWHLILDLSSPEGKSVNNGIPKPFFSVQYITVDSFIDGIMAEGQGTLVAKFDVASAYRYLNVAIHPQDQPLLGMKWHDKYYVNMDLPFRLCSASYIFTSIADMVEWIPTHNHCINFLCHHSASSVCHYNLQASIQLCSYLALSLHPHKMVGPTTCLSILGIELDSTTLQARLPVEKRERITALLDTWSAKWFCKQCELESLIGHLHHACKIAPQRRTFLCQMINLLCTFMHDDLPIWLKQDLTSWRELFQS